MHSCDMKSHDLIRALVEQGGGTLPVAKAMRAPQFQGTLHKICAGHVAAPSHRSAERIAKHFKLPLEAIYDDNVATAIARERGIEVGTTAATSAKMEAPPHRAGDQITAFISTLAGALDSLSEADRERAESALITLARAPDSQRARAALLAAMDGASVPDAHAPSSHGFSAAALDLARQLDAIEDDAARRMAHRDASRAVSLHTHQQQANAPTAPQAQPLASQPDARSHKRR